MIARLVPETKSRGDRAVQAAVAPAPEFRARVVMLGASNLTRGLPTVIETCRRLLGAPIDIHVVTGHGRSYGLDTYVVVRGLPSIRDSSVWRVLEAAPTVPTYGLVADVGNDIMYRVAPSTIVEWVDGCMGRLSALHARQVVTSLPMARLRRMSPANFQLARAIFFPTRRMSMTDALRLAEELDGRLREIAARHDAPVVDCPWRWYGWDPIHMARAAWPEAWGTALAHWIDPDHLPVVRSPAPLSQELRVRLGAPDRWWLFGRIPRGRTQPWLRLDDGTAISMW
jgi:hypothetical protein